jgi:hypothetical protein
MFGIVISFSLFTLDSKRNLVLSLSYKAAKALDVLAFRVTDMKHTATYN